MAIDEIDLGTRLARRAITCVTATGIHADDLATAVNPNRCFLSIATNVVRVSFDTTSPTASVGHVLATGNYMIKGEDTIRDMKFIDTAAGASAITYTLGRNNE